MHHGNHEMYLKSLKVSIIQNNNFKIYRIMIVLLFVQNYNVCRSINLNNSGLNSQSFLQM